MGLSQLLPLVEGDRAWRRGGSKEGGGEEGRKEAGEEGRRINLLLSFPGLAEKFDYTRSEERRVGKECLRLCRSRWSPYH